MADPFTILAVGATALNAYGSYQQGREQQAIADVQSAQLRKNAEAAASEGLRRAEEQRRQMRVALSDARAAQAAGGGTTTDAGALGQLGQLTAAFERNALEETYASQRDAQAMVLQAGLTKASGRSAKRAGTVAALSTVLSGASSIYGPATGQTIKRPKTTRAVDSGSATRFAGMS